MKRAISIAALLCSLTAHAEHNVILITLDGVRAQDILPNLPDLNQADKLPKELAGQRLTPKTMAAFRRDGLIIGDVRSEAQFQSNMRIAHSAPVSLPGYREILTGRRSAGGCTNNDCGYWNVQTLPERLVLEGGLTHDQVAVFASWKRIRQAAVSLRYSKDNEGKPSSLFVVNAGEEMAPIGKNSTLTAWINESQATELKSEGKWEDTRRDKYTWLQALEYLKERPRFLYISFNDTDSWAHLENYSEYAKSLRYFDDWFEKLEATLKVQGYTSENTTIIITTDHGRGATACQTKSTECPTPGADNFPYHGYGPSYDDAIKVWMLAKGPHVHKVAEGEKWKGSRRYVQGDIRPTIEALMGLCPVQEPKTALPTIVKDAKGRERKVRLYGRPIPELIEGIDLAALCAPKVSKRKASETRKPAAQPKPKSKTKH